MTATKYTNHFELLGHFHDYYIDGKYVGSVSNVEKDREVYGYEGRVKSVLKQDIVLRKKTFKAGTEVVTELLPLCGRVINSKIR